MTGSGKNSNTGVGTQNSKTGLREIEVGTQNNGTGLGKNSNTGLGTQIKKRGQGWGKTAILDWARKTIGQG